MKRKLFSGILTCVLATVMCVSLFGCGSKEETTPSKETAKTVSDTTAETKGEKETQETTTAETTTEPETQMQCRIAFAGEWTNGNVQCNIYMLLLNSDGKVMKTIANDELGIGAEDMAIENDFGFRHEDDNVDMKINAYLKDNCLLVENIYGVIAAGPNPPRFEGTYSVYDISAEGGISLSYQIRVVQWQGNDVKYYTTDNVEVSSDDFYGYFEQLGVTFNTVEFSVGLPGPQMSCDYEKILDLNDISAQEPQDAQSVITSLGMAE